MTQTVPATYIVEEDVVYLHNQLRQLEPEAQQEFCKNQLAMLQLPQAGAEHSPADQVYMRKVWRTVQDRVLVENRVNETVKRNIRFSKKFE